MTNNLIQTIEAAERTQVAIGLQLRLVRISLPYGSARAALIFGWHSDGAPFERGKSPLPGVSVSVWSAPSDTVTIIDTPAESDILAAAYYFGAPDLSRYEFRPLPNGKKPHDSSGLLSDFGLTRVVSNYGPVAESIMAEETTRAAEKMIEQAAASGWLSYVYKPGYLRLSGKDQIVDDASLDTTGHRPGPLPAWCGPMPWRQIAPNADAKQHIWEWSPVSRLIPLDHWRAKHQGGALAASFAQAGTALHGDSWQSAVATDLGVSDRTIRAWASGRTRPPAGAIADLTALCRTRAETLARAAESLEKIARGGK